MATLEKVRMITIEMRALMNLDLVNRGKRIREARR